MLIKTNNDIDLTDTLKNNTKHKCYKELPIKTAATN